MGDFSVDNTTLLLSSPKAVSLCSELFVAHVGASVWSQKAAAHPQWNTTGRRFGITDIFHTLKSPGPQRHSTASCHDAFIALKHNPMEALNHLDSGM